MKGFFAILLLCVMPMMAVSEETVNTKEGEQIVIKDDKTWEYKTTPKVIHDNTVIKNFAKVQNAGNSFTTARYLNIAALIMSAVGAAQYSNRQDGSAPYVCAGAFSLISFILDIDGAKQLSSVDMPKGGN